MAIGTPGWWCGARLGTWSSDIDIEAEPDETAYAAEADLFGTQSGGIAGGDASHFREIVHGSEFHVAGLGELAHGVELTGDTFACGDAGLGAAIENFFDGVESGVVNAFSESEIEDVGRRNVVEGQHLKSFQDGKRDAARRRDPGGIEEVATGHPHCRARAVVTSCSVAKPSFTDRPRAVARHQLQLHEVFARNLTTSLSAGYLRIL